MGRKTDKVIINIERATSLYKKGMTIVEVAGELKATPDLIWRRLKKHGVILRKAVKRDQTGSNNSGWKGDMASIASFHFRVEKLKGKPKYCEVCKTTDINKTYDWANLTEKYNDPNDYKRMCRSCHRKSHRRQNERKTDIIFDTDGASDSRR